ncbi:hypothetical protein L596_014435 [Steinernema carpocapsae]|uniref:Uncharacterized protein n=1 Tax=Steinernema carpocapsae TaxID=34508 RepID=A0A4U5NCR5_STECR|nr:hypothetical protein L596_014435 [Steinernema carpocapsae]
MSVWPIGRFQPDRRPALGVIPLSVTFKENFPTSTSLQLSQRHDSSNSPLFASFLPHKVHNSFRSLASNETIPLHAFQVPQKLFPTQVSNQFLRELRTFLIDPQDLKRSENFPSSQLLHSPSPLPEPRKPVALFVFLRAQELPEIAESTRGRPLLPVLPCLPNPHPESASCRPTDDKTICSRRY